MFYLTIFIPLSVSGKLTSTLSGFITRVKPASFGLLCAWREVLILLQQKEVDMWRAAAGDPYPMEKNPDEIPMFTCFVEHGLALLASSFFKGLLEYYGIEYLNLNPNGIFHTFVFVHFAKPSWGSSPTGYSSGSSSA
jgi:hypothetical protein